MQFLIEQYDLNTATWFVLSLLLIVAIFFRFNRFWSLRNLDLAIILSIAPGFMLARSNPEAGYVWSMVLTIVLLGRLSIDTLLQRRPLIEQNLNSQGLGFLAASAIALLTALAFTERPSAETVETVLQAEQLFETPGAPVGPVVEAVPKASAAEEVGPAAKILAAPAVHGLKAVAVGNGVSPPSMIEEFAPPLLAMLSHLAVVTALFYIGRKRFGDSAIGMGMAALYLLLPSTALEVGKMVHVLPAALVLWALAAYRRPLIAGCLLGLACGSFIYAVFLIPVWFAFYGWRGGLRFGAGLASVAALLMLTLIPGSHDVHSFIVQSMGLMDWSMFDPRTGSGDGFWASYNLAYRIPMAAAFAIMLLAFTFWPRHKTFEHLLSHSAAVVVGSQFLPANPGNTYLLWCLPLLLVVVFRPRLGHLVPPKFEARAVVPQVEVSSPTPVLSGSGNGRHLWQ